MRPACRAARVAPVAILFATALSSCAGAQRPVSGEEVARPDAPPPSPTPAHLEAAPLAGRDPREQFSAAVELQRLGDLEGAAALFEAVRRSGAGLPWAGLDAGVLQERLGRAEQAAAAYLATMESHPDFAPAAQNLVRLWLREGRPPGQIERELRDRLERADGVALRVGLAELLLAGGKHDAAGEECKKALQADERNVPALVALATAYAGRGRFELARMVLENARRVDGTDPAVWNRLGLVELALGNRPQAIEDFRTAASLRLDYPEAHANYGAILADADDFAGAAQELELAVKYAPGSAGAWLNLGNAHRGLQAFEKAEAAYRRALHLDPALNDARYNLALLHLDVPAPGLPTLQRLEQGLAWLDEYQGHGGQEPRVAGFRQDAARELERERKRLAREERDRLREETEDRRNAPPPTGSGPDTPRAKEGGAT